MQQQSTSPRIYQLKLILKRIVSFPYLGFRPIYHWKQGMNTRYQVVWWQHQGSALRGARTPLSSLPRRSIFPTAAWSETRRFSLFVLTETWSLGKFLSAVHDNFSYNFYTTTDHVITENNLIIMSSGHQYSDVRPCTNGTAKNVIWQCDLGFEI